MATAPKKTVPAKTPAKAAPAPAKAAPAKAAPAKAAAKAAPAPAPVKAAPAKKAAAKPKAAPVATEPVVGTVVEFLGYPEGTDEQDIMLVQGERYEVLEIDTTGDAPSYIVRCDNPDFNPEVAEDDSTNPSQIEVGIFAEELVISEDQTPLDPEAAPVETPAPVKAKGKAKAAAKVEAQAAAAEAAPVPAGLPDLETEDGDVLAMVESGDDLVGIAQDLETDIESKNFQLGGILYHIKKEETYLGMDDGAYAGEAGFAAFVAAYFKFSYRKAMDLVSIYVKFNQAGLENPAQAVADIGWTKAAKLVPTINAENGADMVELARTNTVEGLTDAIKSQKVNVGGTPGEAKTRTTIKLRFWEDEAADIEATLLDVKETHGLKTVEEAFAYIVAEFKMAQGEAAPVAEAPQQAAAKPATRAAAAKPAATAAKPAVRRATAQAAA